MTAIATFLLAAIAPIAVDKAAHSVTFTARATDIDAGTTVEFAFIGPGSDRAYEAMFVTDASIAEIAKALDAAGIPRGKPTSQKACRFWPVGNAITIEPDLSNYIDDGTNGFNSPIIYTGGLRESSDVPVANTNMPSALFALYGIDQSLMLQDGTLDQSSVYGRFTCRKKLPSGERLSFKISWDGKILMESRELVFKPGKIVEAIDSLKGATRPLDVKPVFSAELSAAEAKAAASALAVVDSQDVRINGFSEGQMFYQGFLPDEKWRDRQKRLAQPLEVRIAHTNVVLTVVDEDWSVEGDDPKLTPHTVSFADVPTKFKGDTCIFFVASDEKLGRIYAIMRKLPRSIRNWYVFVD